MLQTSKATTVAAFFDFDKTLLTVESAKPGLKFLYERKEISLGFVLTVMAANVLYRHHLISEGRMSRLLLNIYRGKRLADFEAGARQFYEDSIKPLLAPNMLEKVSRHARAGHLLVLVSGSVRYYLKEVVRDLKFDHLLCTDLEVGEDGLLTGRTDGPLCIDAQKEIQIRRLAHRFNVDLTASYAYGNHQSDIPMLSLVGNPIAVEPTAPLRSWAQRRGCPIEGFY